MKKFISAFIAVVLISCTTIGCEKNENKISTSPDNSVSESTQRQSTINTKPATTNKTTAQYITTKKTTTSKKSTTIVNKNKKRKSYSSTTRWAGKSNLSEKKRTVSYTQNGEKKSVTVTVVTGFENEMLAYINNEREKLNKSPISLNNQLSEYAITRAAEASVKWSHTRPNGTDCFTILDTDPEFKSHINSAGENLAWNQPNVIKVMQDWMNSSGHRANILRDEYNYVGLAWVKVDRGNGVIEPLWAQMFAKIV